MDKKKTVLNMLKVSCLSMEPVGSDIDIREKVLLKVFNVKYDQGRIFF